MYTLNNRALITTNYGKFQLTNCTYNQMPI